MLKYILVVRDEKTQEELETRIQPAASPDKIKWTILDKDYVVDRDDLKHLLKSLQSS